MGQGELGLLFSMVPFFIIGIIFCIPNGFLAARLGRNVPVWVICTLVPFVNYVFFLYVGYVVLFFVIDKLNELTHAPAK